MNIRAISNNTYTNNKPHLYNWYMWDDTSSTSTINSSLTTFSSGTPNIYAYRYSDYDNVRHNDNLRITGPCSLKMQDGSVIEVDRDGNYEIKDQDAKVTYKANRVREFNRYVNGSDLLEEFIRYCGQLGLSQNQVLNLPIELFINWLIVSAAEQDGEEPEQQDLENLQNHPQLQIEDKANKWNHRCKACGKFLPHQYKKHGIEFCDDTHLLVFMQKHQIGT